MLLENVELEDELDNDGEMYVHADAYIDKKDAHRIVEHFIKVFELKEFITTLDNKGDT